MRRQAEDVGSAVDLWIAGSTESPWLRPSRWIMLILVLSVVTWRTRSVYAGGLDPVVVAKAAFGCLGLALAWAARVSTPRGQPMANTFVWLVLAYGTMSTFGAWTDGGLQVNAVLLVRLVLVTFTVALLIKTFPRRHVLEDLLACFALVALVAAVTGLPSLLREGRLGGGLPAMHSNELSLICALPVIGLIYLVLRERASTQHVLLLFALGTALVATGSRTALLTVLLASLIMLVQVRRLSPVIVVSMLCAIPFVAFLAIGTTTFVSFFAREGAGEGDVATLNSRTIVWEASLNYADTWWTKLFGSGLAIKQIPVKGQYWDIQNLDSSWISALVQAGWLGVIVLSAWVLTLVVMTVRMPWGPRMLTQGLLAALLLRSVLESGLIDSSPAFLTFLIISLLAAPGPLPAREGSASRATARARVKAGLGQSW